MCVGLDPDPHRLTHHYSPDADGIEYFCIDIIDATAEYACAFKPQIAYFAAARAEAQLERICAYIRANYPTIPIILDAKRGDIGDTATMYAREAFDRYGAHAVTVNPYMGGDTIEPYLVHPKGAAIVLCRTSNAGSGGAHVGSLSDFVAQFFAWLVNQDVEVSVGAYFKYFWRDLGARTG